jgi:hypothetical protein
MAPVHANASTNRSAYMAKPSLADDLPNWPVELLKIVGPQKAEELSGVSWETIKRRSPDKILDLSENRRGIRVGDALLLRGK